MTPHSSFAKEHTAVEYLLRCMVKTLHTDRPPTERLICEHVPISESNVEPEILDRVMHKLQLWENDLRQNMNRFQMTETVLPSFLATPAPETAKPDEPVQPQPPAPKQRRKKP